MSQSRARIDDGTSCTRMIELVRRRDRSIRILVYQNGDDESDRVNYVF
jgi:hypothetical protein